MHKLLTDTPGEQMLLLGNEAIARGALEAGVAFATCYPGTPSSEIPENFLNISRESDLYFEYSTNEKVAMEVAAGAAVSGLRTMVTMKHVGLNVAADPLMTLAYTGIKGGMVIINADDPSLFSSQNEQDNRYYARLSGLPMLEPTNTQEMKDITVAAFDLSEKLELPVIIRTTTRLAHIRGAVRLGALKPIQTKAHFEKNPFRFATVPAVSRNLHKLLVEKYDQAAEKSDSGPYNRIIGDGKWGIVANGVSFNYVNDAVSDLGIKDKVSILKLGFSWPLPEALCIRFLKGVDKVLVVEELDPINEIALKAMAQENGISISINGKGTGAFPVSMSTIPGWSARRLLNASVSTPHRLKCSTPRISQNSREGRPTSVQDAPTGQPTMRSSRFTAQTPSTLRISAVIPWGYCRPSPWPILSSAWAHLSVPGAGFPGPRTRRSCHSSAIPLFFTPALPGS